MRGFSVIVIGSPVRRKRCRRPSLWSRWTCREGPARRSALSPAAWPGRSSPDVRGDIRRLAAGRGRGRRCICGLTMRSPGETAAAGGEEVSAENGPETTYLRAVGYFMSDRRREVSPCQRAGCCRWCPPKRPLSDRSSPAWCRQWPGCLSPWGQPDCCQCR